MRIVVDKTELHLSDCHTRIPFRFGIHTLTEAPLLVATLYGHASDGSEVLGYSSELLVPRWFEKNPERSIGGDIRSLLESAEAAASMLTDGQSASVFDHWWRTFEGRVLSQPTAASDRLTRGFGCSLWERAMLDGVARAAGISFFEAMDCDLYRFDPARIHPELDRWNFSVAAVGKSLAVRHTIGLVDALGDGDGAVDAPDDGLPVTLLEDIERYRLGWFKIKVSGDPQEDLERLRRIAALLCGFAPAGWRVTLDGNEQYDDPAALAGVLGDLGKDEDGRRLLAVLDSIEQPLSRTVTFDGARNRDLPALTRFAPVIIDEADHGPEAFPAAVALGYRGVSTKNCKGVFRSLANRGLCEVLPGGLFQSAEDLTNLPLWGLQQDLATVALLGLSHVERNGHHYFHGLSHLSDGEVESALAHHGDLYRRSADGAELAIEDGSIAIGSLTCEGYGCQVTPDNAVRLEASRYRPPEE